MEGRGCPYHDKDRGIITGIMKAATRLHYFQFAKLEKFRYLIFVAYHTPTDFHHSVTHKKHSTGTTSLRNTQAALNRNNLTP